MAEKLCELKKKGGGNLKETVLWTNPNPSAGFAGGDITVPDMSEYTYIKVTYSIHESSFSNLAEVIVPYETLKIAVSYNYSFRSGLCSYSGDNNLFWTRILGYASDTILTFGEALGYFYGRTPVVSTNISIPIQIIGIK